MSTVWIVLVSVVGLLGVKYNLPNLGCIDVLIPLTLSVSIGAFSVRVLVGIRVKSLQ